jgi:hypothetical protein
MLLEPSSKWQLELGPTSACLPSLTESTGKILLVYLGGVWDYAKFSFVKGRQSGKQNPTLTCILVFKCPAFFPHFFWYHLKRMVFIWLVLNIEQPFYNWWNFAFFFFS